MKFETINTFLNTLFYSWGSDAPAEAVWAANDFLKVLGEQFNHTFINEFSESYNETYPDNNFQIVMDEIRTLFN